ncbi:hypothetical protein SETIT_9G022700v2 [Setaria italica]|uniref:X8 domain-containing protein n=1 Tax=Setaria italica TaxID=4555 RepID=K4A7B7_SETIT|nr:uncharacterized protein LOC101759448 [Setaria italica]RCV40079.1 hypothetical protein SETIT_9G022700v2 [Setaria italica]
MAATRPLALTFFFCCILLLETICCSGAFVELSYDSTQVKIPSSSVITECRVMVTEKQHAYLFLKPFECRPKSCRPEHVAGSFVNEVLDPNRQLNISNIVVTATKRKLGRLRRTLQSIHASLGAAGLAQSVRVSPELMLSSLRIMAKDRAHKKQWSKIRESVRRSGSFVQVKIEAEANSELAVAAEIQEAVADVAALLGSDAGVVLHLKSRAAPSAVAMAKLVGDISREKRLLGVLVDVSSPRRELGEARATAHDEFSPVTNPAATPVTNPVTVPATNPVSNPMSPGFVTVPSTNPGDNGFSTNPNLPPLYPEPTTPATMPDPTTMPPSMVPTPFTSPVTAPTMPGPVTNPAAPVTNPATTPTQFPGTSPVTNPVTTYPYPQQGGAAGAGGIPTAPVYQPPATMPGTVQPSAPAVAGAGQTWCVAKTGLTDLAMQDGIDYACGMGGADCSAIQPMGSCYNPNTLQAHASYAFNSYFQKNPSPASCDFGGAGMLVNVNPSSGTCMYQTSSSGFGAGYSPGATGTVPTGYTPGMSGAVPTGYSPGWQGGVGGGSGSTVLNANNPGGNSMYGGSDNPTGLTAGAAPLSCGWVLCLIWMVTFAFVKEKV